MSIRQLTDALSRPIRDLRLSVTDRCNFRCAYCMPKELFGDDYAFMPRAELLTFEEMSRLVSLFTGLGVQKVRLTGGEPLLRKNLDELVKEIHTIPGVQDIGLTTNGLLLGQHAEALYHAGLRRLNISLDALTPSIFGQLNGRGVQPHHILHQIDYARSLGYRIKINMVVQKGVNEDEILPMAEYFRTRGITLRFIEFMDAGSGNGWSYEKVVTQAEILQQLQSRYELVPSKHTIYGEVANYYRYHGTDTEVGFITSVSNSFCSSCTRARLSSDGKLYTCLFATSGYDLRQLLRGGADDEELQDIIADIWEHRTDRYSDLRTAHTASSCRRIGMSYIGG
ncbi:GTP 3',8-cyclase MoaA [Paenibacillus wulumuqiensis]|uniref:GTP 3',8-cyclase MoaA n=1 Tax=Paenibacillus wulumuqiensis TaxID=1567107 RepID=UPI00061904AA|nr:GTP 3',8-cyclase MoaA [Paenibacillus wulumuqiensis]